MPTLQTLAPGKKGDEISHLQRMLNRALYPSPNLRVDGDYGRLTTAAVKRFQSHAGLPATGRADAQTLAVLECAFRSAVAVRPAKHTNTSALKESAVQTALSQLGVEEAGGDNRGEKVEMYLASTGNKPGEPWCASFVSWCFASAAKSVEADNPMRMTASCLTIYKWAKETGRLVNPPERGDVFLVKGGPRGVRHTGFVIRALKNAVETVEGNTNDDGSANGYGVFKRKRNIDTCYFVRVC